MNKIIIIIAILFIGMQMHAQDQTVTLSNGKKAVLHADKTWEYYEGLSYDYDFSKLVDNQIPSFLRQGIKVDIRTLVISVEMYLQGWRYTMPRPKSSQATWGNSDGRTTWWQGYWYNNKTYNYSRETPIKQSNGYYYGDEQNEKGYWRNGGTPSYPSKIDWLLSSNNGVKPY